MPLIPRTRVFDAEPHSNDLQWRYRMADAVLGIDVSKDTLDAECVQGKKKQGRKFANDPDGWRRMLAWLGVYRTRLSGQ